MALTPPSSGARPRPGPFERAAPADRRATALLGLTILGVGLLLVYLLYEIWPVIVHATGVTPTRQNVTLFGGRIEFSPATESALVLLVILAGALGAYVHAATSFSKYVGVRQFDRSWHWWYLLRLPIGSALALILYFALRGGLLGTDATSADVNPYGVAALAALAGLFSKQAIDKLSEVFDTFFRTRAEARDLDALETPIPELETIQPKTFSSTQAQELKLVGRGFDDDSAVLIKAAAADAPILLRTDKVSLGETEFVVAIAAGELAPGEYTVMVVNSPPGGGISRAQSLTIEP